MHLTSYNMTMPENLLSDCDIFILTRLLQMTDNCARIEKIEDG